jgi:hypothetical protein
METVLPALESNDDAIAAKLVDSQKNEEEREDPGLWFHELAVV